MDSVSMKRAEEVAVRNALDHLYSMVENLNKPEFVGVVSRWLQDKGVAPEEVFGFEREGSDFEAVPLESFDNEVKRIFDALMGGEPIRAIYTKNDVMERPGVKRNDPEELEDIARTVHTLDKKYLPTR